MDKFSKRSRLAIVAFTVCFLLIVLIPRIYFYYTPTTKFSLTERMHQLPEKEKVAVKKRIKKYHDNQTNKIKKQYKTPPSKFDPNKYELKDWMRLGLSEKQAQTILNFNKYGFDSEKDLLKCFIFENEDFFSAIKDSLSFPDKAFAPNLAVDLNRASKKEMMKLKGIGNFFADKIIEYRERLGGYINVNQLLEVYKFDQEKLHSIKPYILINKNDIQKIDLNTVDTRRLKNHPYINDWNLANSIIKIREQKVRYTKVKEIKESVLMNDSIYKRIEPYLIIK